MLCTCLTHVEDVGQGEYYIVLEKARIIFDLEIERVCVGRLWGKKLTFVSNNHSVPHPLERLSVVKEGNLDFSLFSDVMDIMNSKRS